MKRKALCILGMHRSGTSAIAGSLIHCGIAGPNTPLPAAEDNPLGFWEPMPLVQLHDELLSRIGLTWDSWDSGIDLRVQRSFEAEDRQQLQTVLESEFGDANPFVLKDPRLCLMLPLWRELSAAQDFELCPILVIRSPLEVALSLHKRDGLELQAAALMWLRYNLLAERWTRELQRVFIAFDSFMRDSRKGCRDILASFDLEAPPACHELDFVTAALRHHQTEDFALIELEKLRQLLQNVYADLLSLRSAPNAQTYQRLDAAALALDRLLAERPDLLPQRGMVTRVQLNKKSPGVLGFNLELPLAGSLIRHRSLEFLGWLLPERSENPPELELWQGEMFCGTITPDLPREDVAKAFPSAAHAERSGFKCRIKLDPQQPYLTLELRRPAAADATPGKLMAKISAWLPPNTLDPEARYLPLAAQLLEQGDRLGADLVLNAAISMLRVDEVDAALALAREYRDRERTERHIDILRRILHGHPEHPETNVQLMQAYKQQQDFESALQVLTALLNRHPLWLSLHLESAQVLQALHRHAEAVEHLRRFLESTPDHLEAIIALADSLLASGDPASAAQGYQRALQIQPDAEAALLGLAQALDTQATLKIGEARAALQQAQQLCQQVFQLKGETPAVASLEAHVATALAALEQAQRS